MPKGTREKPTLVNECWVADNHLFDVFVLNTQGKPVRPWICAMSDACSNAIVSWRICEKPNSTTIADTFADGVAEKDGSPMFGIPTDFYSDNGKDYRSKRFEGIEDVEVHYGELNAQIDKGGLLQVLGVRMHRAIPFSAWSKPIENIFGILEDSWLRDVPGWCGGKPEDRPQDFPQHLRRLVERGELWTMDEFAAHFENVILQEYHARVQAGETLSPMEIHRRTPKARADVPSWDVLSMIKDKSETRMVSPSGIKFHNALYWHSALADHIGSEVTIRYNDGDVASITVMSDGMFVAQAELKRRLKFVNEDEDVLAAHMAAQNKARRNTRAAIKQSREIVRRATGGQFGPRVNTASRGTYTDINAERRARAKAEGDAKRATRGRDKSADRVRDKFLRDGLALEAARK